MPIQGKGLKDTNFRLRFFMLIFMGILALGSVIYWRTKALTAAQYVALPNHKDDLQKYEDSKLHSKNYQLDVQDSSATAQ